MSDGYSSPGFIPPPSRDDDDYYPSYRDRLVGLQATLAAWTARTEYKEAAEEVLELLRNHCGVVLEESPRESLAAQMHEIWAHWMRYLFSCCTFEEIALTRHALGESEPREREVLGRFATIPMDKVDRWTRQMGTPYADLTEKEKNSDRDQADKVLNTLQGAG